jgi:hypothetical protein
MPAVFIITHPGVAIDPSIPVPDWPLNERRRMRHTRGRSSSVALTGLLLCRALNEIGWRHDADAAKRVKVAQIAVARDDDVRLAVDG